jgi:hypothetical protein
VSEFPPVRLCPSSSRIHPSSAASRVSFHLADFQPLPGSSAHPIKAMD